MDHPRLHVNADMFIVPEPEFVSVFTPKFCLLVSRELSDVFVAYFSNFYFINSPVPSKAGIYGFEIQKLQKFPVHTPIGNEFFLYSPFSLVSQGPLFPLPICQFFSQTQAPFATGQKSEYSFPSSMSRIHWPTNPPPSRFGIFDGNNFKAIPPMQANPFSRLQSDNGASWKRKRAKASFHRRWQRG